MKITRRSLAVLAAGSALAGVTAGAAPATAATTHQVLIYYVGDTGIRAALYRELRGLPTTTTPIRQAVNNMLHLAPRDPDYKSLWPTATTIRGISVRDRIAKVDLSRDALAGTAGSEFACASLQQLVYTVTAASKGTVSKVALLVEGRSAGVVSTFWGVGCGPDRPMALRPAVRILAPVQIRYPGHNRTVPRVFTIRGEAAVFEAVVSWALVDVKTGRVVREGVTLHSPSLSNRGPWSVRVSLSAFYSGRRMEVQASMSSADDGSVTFLDDKTVTIA